MQSERAGEPPEPTDAELVGRARKGFERAFELLVRRYQGLALSRAYALLYDRAEAEDAAQEAFLRAFRSLGQLRQPEAFAPWLLETVANVARRAASKRARRAAAPLDASTTEGRRVRSGLLDAIATLPEGYQQVIHLHYVQGHTCIEIGRILGLEVGSVTSRLVRARRMLREILREDEK